MAKRLLDESVDVGRVTAPGAGEGTQSRYEGYYFINGRRIISLTRHGLLHMARVTIVRPCNAREPRRFRPAREYFFTVAKCRARRGTPARAARACASRDRRRHERRS